jgi:serine/threonine protein kinase
MPTVIVNSKTLDLDSISGAEALQIVKGLAAQLGTGRDAKTGTLNIVGRDGQWQIRRQSGWSRFWNFGFQRSLGERETAQVLNTLFEKAFSAAPSAMAQAFGLLPSSKAVASLRAYLEKTTHVDAKKLSMLLHDAIGTKRLDRSGDIRSMSESEVLAQLGVKDEDGNPIEEFYYLEHFAKGSYGFVADIPPDKSGKPRVIKIEQKPEIVDLTGKHGHRSRDVSAAYLRGLDGVLNVPGVIAPTHFIFRSADHHEKFYLVPSENVRAFLATQKGKQGKLEFVGQVMPKVDGHSLAQCNKGEKGASPLDAGATHTAARQMHWTLVRLATHGFVHHDIKPANFMWDSARGRVSMIDFGMLHKTHKEELDPQIRYGGGTPLYSHPHAGKGWYHGPEYDAFSTAITLLETAANSDTETQTFAQRRENFAKVRLETEIPPDGSYLLNWLKATLPENERATPENNPLYAAYAERIGDVDKEIPTVENYCHHLIQASFLTGEYYLDRMTELASHPYLMQELGGPLATNRPSSVPITSPPGSTPGSHARID